VAGGLVLVVLALATGVAAAEFHGQVVGVTDGDTITVLHDGRPEVVRLNGIDAPEKRQAFGERAKQFTASLAFGKTVSVRSRDRDRYGRTIGDVILSDGKSLSQEMVRAGYAWWFRRYSTDSRLANLEAQARAAHTGLWADSNPVPPWEWRRARRDRSSRRGRVTLDRRQAEVAARLGFATPVRLG
jgi:endonuclease YncB( thermonuclease family)